MVSVGALARLSLDVGELLGLRGVDVTVVDPRWVKPVNPALVAMAHSARLVVTVEDNLRDGGFGAALAQRLRDEDVPAPVLNFVIPQRFLDHGKRAEVLADCGLTAEHIADEILGRVL